MKKIKYTVTFTNGTKREMWCDDFWEAVIKAYFIVIDEKLPDHFVIESEAQRYSNINLVINYRSTTKT